MPENTLIPTHHSASKLSINGHSEKVSYGSVLCLMLALLLGTWTPVAAQENDGEIEIILDGLVAPGGGLGQEEEDDGEIEIILDGLLAGGQLSAAARRDLTCLRQTSDDHADSMPCATPVAAGEVAFGDLTVRDLTVGSSKGIGSSAVLDRDLFLLIVPPTATGVAAWQWIWSADVDLQVRWLDASGEPLAIFDLAAGERVAVPWRFVGGFYYLEVEAMPGAAAEPSGTYAWALRQAP